MEKGNFEWGVSEPVPGLTITKLDRVYAVSERRAEGSIRLTEHIILEQIANRARALWEENGFPTEEVVRGGELTDARIIRIGRVRRLLNLQGYIDESGRLWYCRTKVDGDSDVLDMDTRFLPQDEAGFHASEIIDINSQATEALLKAKQEFKAGKLTGNGTVAK